MFYRFVPPSQLYISVHAKPGAKLDKLLAPGPTHIPIQLAAKPVDGEANACLIGYLAEVFSVRKSDCLLVRGERGREKVVLVNVDRFKEDCAKDVGEFVRNKISRFL